MYCFLLTASNIFIYTEFENIQIDNIRKHIETKYFFISNVHVSSGIIVEQDPRDIGKHQGKKTCERASTLLKQKKPVNEHQRR